jgi:hypothetical protein
MFDFDLADAAAAYAAQGWVHMPGAVHSEFLDELRGQATDASSSAPLRAKGLRGEKEQRLLELPAGLTWETELFDVIAPLCGLVRSTMALSERHIKSYREDADPCPAAHKDRFASQISIGLTVEVQEGSHLVLFPDTDRGENPYLDARLRESLEPDQLPEVVLAAAPEVAISDRPGDVTVFPGSDMWHLRRGSAGTTAVYLKVNDFDCDPLGEDPTTGARRAQTVALAEAGPEHELLRSIPTLSRRFESVNREHRREGWPEFLVANVWGERPFPVSGAEFDLLRALDGVASVSDLVARLGAGTPEGIRRLAQRGAIDLLRADR